MACVPDICVQWMLFIYLVRRPCGNNSSYLSVKTFLCFLCYICNTPTAEPYYVIKINVSS